MREVRLHRRIGDVQARGDVGFDAPRSTMRRDVAILKALGASTPALVRDAVGQALVVLLVGVGIGLTAILGALADGALPSSSAP
ncbi:hypothetical protein SAMN04487848_2738 [Microbacterium sp. ru370.1]|uniref:FtsX-like permease family protein n=1 Tax=unclassified Microbacterium TaxID=2609290 RepID=UPI000882CADC|nr:hypothetical protein [Microbacterium sp. RU1D]SDO96445.1 hypothetical protein SAMN04487848_2738 [Microbacterium sp. ru370.1]SIT92904.1 hypothetical protein SAMN05880579_2842 [Microbacterium sp. RU1D]